MLDHVFHYVSMAHPFAISKSNAYILEEKKYEAQDKENKKNLD